MPYATNLRFLLFSIGYKKHWKEMERFSLLLQMSKSNSHAIRNKPYILIIFNRLQEALERNGYGIDIIWWNRQDNKRFFVEHFRIFGR
jgi:hypothetical protein